MSKNRSGAKKKRWDARPSFAFIDSDVIRWVRHVDPQVCLGCSKRSGKYCLYETSSLPPVGEILFKLS